VGGGGLLEAAGGVVQLAAHGTDQVAVVGLRRVADAQPLLLAHFHERTAGHHADDRALHALSWGHQSPRAHATPPAGGWASTAGPATVRGRAAILESMRLHRKRSADWRGHGLVLLVEEVGRASG